MLKSVYLLLALFGGSSVAVVVNGSQGLPEASTERVNRSAEASPLFVFSDPIIQGGENQEGVKQVNILDSPLTLAKEEPVAEKSEKAKEEKCFSIFGAKKSVEQPEPVVEPVPASGSVLISPQLPLNVHYPVPAYAFDGRNRQRSSAIPFYRRIPLVPTRKVVPRSFFTPMLTIFNPIRPLESTLTHPGSSSGSGEQSHVLEVNTAEASNVVPVDRKRLEGQVQPGPSRRPGLIQDTNGRFFWNNNYNNYYDNYYPDYHYDYEYDYYNQRPYGGWYYW